MAPRRTATKSHSGLDQVLLSLFAAVLAAFAAHAVDDHAVTRDAESMLDTDFFKQLGEWFALELEQLATTCAVQMVVLRVTVIVFVDRASLELEAFQQPGVDKFTQRTIDRRAADIVLGPFARQAVNQFVGIKMVVMAKDLIHQRFPLAGLSKPTRLQILLKTLLRG